MNRPDLVKEGTLDADSELELIYSPESPTRVRRVRFEGPFELELRHLTIAGVEQLSGPAPLGMLSGERFPDFEFETSANAGDPIVLTVGNPTTTPATFRLWLVE